KLERILDFSGRDATQPIRVEVCVELVEASSRHNQLAGRRQLDIHPRQRHALALVKPLFQAAQEQAIELVRQAIEIPGQPPPLVLLDVTSVDDPPQVNADRNAVDTSLVIDHAAGLAARDDIACLPTGVADAEVGAARLLLRNLTAQGEELLLHRFTRG